MGKLVILDSPWEDRRFGRFEYFEGSAIQVLTFTMHFTGCGVIHKALSVGQKVKGKKSWADWMEEIGGS
jgi:hypothetical protein